MVPKRAVVGLDPVTVKICHRILERPEVLAILVVGRRLIITSASYHIKKLAA